MNQLCTGNAAFIERHSIAGKGGGFVVHLFAVAVRASFKQMGF